MKFALLITCVFLSLNLAAQNQYSLSVIAGQYAMKDMKSIQNDQFNDLNNSGLPVVKELSFPMSLQAEFDVDRMIAKRTWAGGFVNYTVTKGKAGYSDYSGEASVSQNVSRIAIGGRIRQLLPNNFEVYGKLGANYSILDMSSHYAIVGSAPEDDKLGFHSLGFLIEPGLGWVHFFGKSFLRLHAGYEFSFSGKTILNDDSNSYLLTGSGSTAKIDWTGVRLGVSLGHTF